MKLAALNDSADIWETIVLTVAQFHRCSCNCVFKKKVFTGLKV